MISLLICCVLAASPIEELRAEVDALKRDIAAIEAELAALKLRVAKIEARLDDAKVMTERPPGPKPQVIIYSADWCATCKEAKEFFKENGVTYWEVLDHEYTSLPVIKIGDKEMGWNEEVIRQLLDLPKPEAKPSPRPAAESAPTYYYYRGRYYRRGSS